MFNQQVFDNVYTDLENFFYKKVSKGFACSPIENFYCENEIKLTKNSKIRKIFDYEKGEYLELQQLSVSLPISDVATLSNMLEIAYCQRRDKTSNEPLYWRDFEDVITSLRLFKHGSVNFHVLNGKSELWNPSSVNSYDLGKNDYKRLFGPKYTLTFSEEKNFKAVYRRFSKFQKRNRIKVIEYLTIALRRFNLGIEEFDVEDKMIDFMISFEAMFLQNEGELKFKLSNRVAVLLGKTSGEREIIREIINQSYQWRSDIVHGNPKHPLKIQGNIISEVDLAVKVEDILRKSLLGFICLTEKNLIRENILRQLDNSLLNMKVMNDLHKKAGI